VYVYGGDVFVAGEEEFRAVLWVNGVPQTLSDLSDIPPSEAWSRALSVHVSGGDIFVAGWAWVYNIRAVLWINAVPQTLSDTWSQALFVHVSGGDVFVAGETGFDFNRRAVLWINSVPHTLSDNPHWLLLCMYPAAMYLWLEV
jgi:hypothetical protein